MTKRRKIFLIAIPALLAIASAQAAGGELTPYHLPSEDASVSQMQAPVQVNKSQISSEELYYRIFEDKTAGIPKADKQRLLEKFTSEETKSAQKKDYESAAHYHRLGEIMKRSLQP